MYVAEGTSAEKIATLITPDPITLGVTALTYGFQAAESLTGGDGIDISAGIISVDLVSDGGLEFIGGELQVKFADTSVAADLDGTNGLHAISAEDLSSNGADQGAKIIGFDPSISAFFTAEDNVQDALDLVGDTLVGVGLTQATTDLSGVTKGDPLYYSGAGIVSKYPNNTNDKPIGYAADTVGASLPVNIKTIGVLTGVISGAAFGTQYYWDGTNHVTTPPNTAGTRVFPTGVAVNATDLHLQPIPRLKKNT